MERSGTKGPGLRPPSQRVQEGAGHLLKKEGESISMIPQLCSTFGGESVAERNKHLSELIDDLSCV